MTSFNPILLNETIDLLKQLITIPSFSREEDKTARCLREFLERKDIIVNQSGNNIWAVNQYFDTARPTILLNSHHDTVKPNPGYTRDPFKAEIIDGKLFGLGSNDAGGPLVSMIAAFLHFYQRQNLKYNLVLAATAEEEISGRGGIESIWNQLPVIDFAVVGEPTLCKMAIAEKGLLVLDCVAKGSAGHAAHQSGDNAIYRAMKDIDWFRKYRFSKVSETLGEVKMTVTVIEAGKQHNVIPAECKFTVDVRVTDVYSLEEVIDEIRKHIGSEVMPRSVRLRPSGIAPDHPLVKAAHYLGIDTYGSPTTSDQSLIPAPSVKIGPGDSSRSHVADEYIGIKELENGIETYLRLIDYLVK